MMSSEKKRIDRLFSALGVDMERHETPTPQMPLFTTGVQEPALLQGITIPALYAASYECLVLRSILNHLATETFRKGWTWKPKFVKKCRQCDEEYKKDVEDCRKCGGEVRSADKDQLEYAEALLGADNRMTQSFLEVLREVEMDLNIVDDAYIILTKEYFVDPNTGQPQFYRIKEITRADPIFMRIVADKRGVRGGKQYTSLLDRSFRTSDKDEKCPKTGLPVVPVHYMNLAGVGAGQVYTEGEVIHLSKWSPSKLYGRSPVATLWRQVNTLIAMDNYVYSAYQKRRMPRGVMVIKSSNLETVERTARNIQEHLERDPQYIPTVGVETETGRGGLEYVRMMDTLEELQYIPIKDDIRQRISSFYGVSNVFMNDVSGGGLNNEGMQIVVTNRALAASQNLYNNRLFPILMDALQITEWEILLNPHEEEDEIMAMRRDEMAIRNMMQMKQAGYDANLRDDDGFLQFDYKEAPPPPPQTGPPPEGAPPPQGGGQMAKAHHLPPTIGDLVKRNVEDDIHGSIPIPSAMTTTHGTDLRPLRTRGRSQLNLHSRRSGGKSPDRVNRFSGEHHMSQTIQDRRDSEKSAAEKNVDERMKNLDRKHGL
tara:strand:+ start:517 stop:2313 length:1797 start_codon:yes stop_codon:yes gene_type:complete